MFPFILISFNIGEFIGLSMKIILTLILCSYTSGSCLAPYEWPTQYDDMYDCMMSGYEQSMIKMESMGKDDVNKHQIYIRFTCMPLATT